MIACKEAITRCQCCFLSRLDESFENLTLFGPPCTIMKVDKETEKQPKMMRLLVKKPLAVNVAFCHVWMKVEKAAKYDVIACKQAVGCQYSFLSCLYDSLSHLVQ